MRTWLTTLLLIPAPALAGDVWMTLDDVDEGVKVHLDLPAAWLLDGDGSHAAVRDGEPVDLRAEAEALASGPEGQRRQYVVESGDGARVTVTLHHRKRSRRARVSTLAVDLGPMLSVESFLDEGVSALSLDTDEVSLHGNLRLDTAWLSDPEHLAVLRHAPPTRLVRIEGTDGEALVIETR